ncbi:MAG: helix-turn-helix domain-containing protein [Algoriphagus sp.]|nr:helix-turn-helix domain-containing protein [Algoriphagus sp.]
MIFQSFQPSPELVGLVKTYHIRHFEFPANTNIPVKPFAPRSEQYITFYVKGFETIYLPKDQVSLTRSKTSIIGQSTQLVQRKVSPQFLIVQVPFFPGALYRLTGIPFDELRDKSLEMDLIFPQETKVVDQKLHEAKSYWEMIRIVDDFFISLARSKVSFSKNPFERALPFFSDSFDDKRIDLLADQACLSLRQFERLSKNYFGVGPKTMMRINRFSESFILKSRHPEYSWFDVAISCGYVDYQHMVRDYKDFAGVTPNQLWIADGKAPDRVLGLR